MSKAKERFGIPVIPFIDVFVMMAGTAIAMAFLNLLQIKPPDPKKENNVQMKAEFMVSMSWPDESFDDLDLWMRLPTGQTVNYRSSDIEFAKLDRDDRGAMSDSYWRDAKKSEKVLIRVNKEVIALRAFIPGRYVVAVHVYDTSTKSEGFSTEMRLPYRAKLEVMKLNPTATIVASTDAMLMYLGQRKTFLSFEIGQDGSVSNIDYEATDDIVLLEKE